VIKPPSNFNSFNRRLEYSISLQGIADLMVARWPLGNTEPPKIFSGTFLIMAICTWDRPPSPPPPRVAGQCEAQRAFGSLRLISLLDLAGNAQVRPPKSGGMESKKQMKPPVRGRRRDMVTKARQRGRCGAQLARFFR
jgi:hypothetical protein